MNDSKTLEPSQTLYKPTRRSLLGAIGVGAIATLGLASLSKPSFATTTANPNQGDIDILNFALNLEYLEAEFYTVATTGKYISEYGFNPTSPTAGLGTAGTTAGSTTVGAGTTPTGGSLVNFYGDPILTPTALQIAHDERTHVVLLRETIIALGGQPIAEPAINLDALGLGYGNPNEFLTLSRAFEDTGVSAYGGAANGLKNPAVLQAAAQILAVEAYHASNARLQLIQNGVTVGALDSLDVPPSTSHFFDVTNALAVIRTPQQVLTIAYGASGVTKGGFFPNGINGAFHGLVSA